MFKDEHDYDRIEQGDRLAIKNVRGQIETSEEITVSNQTQGFDFVTIARLSERDKAILLAGGKLNYTREQASKN